MFSKAMQPFQGDKMSGKISPGIVINNNDPEKNQRIMARITGMHKDRPDGDMGWSAMLGWSPQGFAPGVGCYSVPVVGARVAIFFPDEHEERSYYFSDYPDSSCKISEFLDAYPNAYGWADSAGNLWLVNTATGIVLFRHVTGSYTQYDQNGNIEYAAANNLLIKAAGTVAIDAAQIQLNQGTAAGLQITPRNKPAPQNVSNMTNY